MIPPINLWKFQKLAHAAILRGIPYKLGGKAPYLDCSVNALRGIDCSGFIRWLIYKSTPKLIIPDGSYNQYRWMKAQGLKEVPYSQTQESIAGESSTLYFAFILASRAIPVGHIWAVLQNGDTIESYGGHGPGSRRWNHRPLPQEVGAAFIWNHVWVPD